MLIGLLHPGEIAATFGAAEAPTGFHEAAAQMYRRYPRA